MKESFIWPFLYRYMPVRKWDSLQQLLHEALENHNDVLPVMNLVLFEDAIMHVYVNEIIKTYILIEFLNIAVGVFDVCKI